MKIFLLEAKGPSKRNTNVGVFTSKIKADKAWRQWKYAFRGTTIFNYKKVLMVWVANTFLDNRKV